MKNVIILPGNSPTNFQIFSEYEKQLNKQNETKVHFIKYDHWQSNQSIKLKNEMSKLIELLNLENIFIIAKSVGTIILSMAFKEICKSNTKKITLLGTPISRIQGEDLSNFSSNLEKIQKTLSIPITFIQAINDPYGGSREICEKLSSLINNDMIKVIEIDRNDHTYPFDDVKKFLF